MKYSEVSHGFAIAIAVLGLLFLIYAVWYDAHADPPEITTGYRKFVREISARLHQIPELDELEKRKIEDAMQGILKKKEEKKTANITKSCVVGATRGCLTGLIAGGGLEGALVGGAVFGTMSPVILGVEYMMS
jgi:hypothetical protein